MVLCVAIKAGAESESYVKAAFLYNFAKFVEWPAGTFENPEAPVVLCILGKDPFGPALRTIENKTVGKRKLFIVKRLELSGKENIHILFVSTSEKKNAASILSALRNRPVLTVSDTQGFAHSGGMICLIKADRKIRFEINVRAAKLSGLKISSRLLKLARIVEQGH